MGHLSKGWSICQKGWSICQKGGPFVKRCGPFVKGVPEPPFTYTTCAHRVMSLFDFPWSFLAEASGLFFFSSIAVFHLLRIVWATIEPGWATGCCLTTTHWRKTSSGKLMSQLAEDEFFFASVGSMQTWSKKNMQTSVVHSSSYDFILFFKMPKRSLFLSQIFLLSAGVFLCYTIDHEPLHVLSLTFSSSTCPVSLQAVLRWVIFNYFCMARNSHKNVWGWFDQHNTLFFGRGGGGHNAIPPWFLEHKKPSWIRLTMLDKGRFATRNSAQHSELVTHSGRTLLNFWQCVSHKTDPQRSSLKI